MRFGETDGQRGKSYIEMVRRERKLYWTAARDSRDADSRVGEGRSRVEDDGRMEELILWMGVDLDCLCFEEEN